jgi:DnaJ-class molecular chaperone
MDNYYQTLGVNQTVTPDNLKKAYRNLAKKWHPDKHSAENKQQAENVFKKLSEAFDVLSDPSKRSEYDMRLGMGIDSTGDQRQSFFTQSNQFVFRNAPDLFTEIFLNSNGINQVPPLSLLLQHFQTQGESTYFRNSGRRNTQSRQQMYTFGNANQDGGNYSNMTFFY